MAGDDRSADPAQMEDVRDLAREVRMRPIDLVRELVADGVEVLPVGKRSWRVWRHDFDRWYAARTKRLAAEVTQAIRRADYVGRGANSAPKRCPVFRR